MDLRRSLLVFVCLVAAAFSPPSGAQSSYPGRPIRFIVPYGAGGGTDFVARLVGEKMAARLGQPIVVENKPGAGSSIGMAAVAKAAPDGYTMLLVAPAATANPSLYDKLPFDVTRDFEHVGMISSAPVMLMASSKAPFRTFDAFLDYAKANPGKLSYASSGTGTVMHLGVELLKLDLGLDVVHIPYKSAGAALPDVLGGQVALFSGTPATIAEFVKDGRMHVLISMSATKVPGYPDVPLVSERLPGFQVSTWNAIFMPKGTPADVVQTISRTLKAVLEDPATQDELAKAGFYPDFKTPEQMHELVLAEVPRWERVIKTTGIKQ